MTEPALREQLSNYIVRRVNANAQLVVNLQESCDSTQWLEAAQMRQLLDASEKLSKLSLKLPDAPFAEDAQKISFLLKLGNMEEKPSHKARTGIKEAASQIKTQLDTDTAPNQPSGESLEQTSITRIYVLLKNKTLAKKITTDFSDLPIEILTSLKQKDLEPGACVIVDCNYPRTGQGFSTAKKIKDNNPESHFIFYSPERLTFETRLEAVRSEGQAIISKVLSPSVIREALSKAFNMSFDKPLLVAVLDDSLSQLKYAENLLQNSGYRTLCVNQPEDLLSAMGQDHPDLLLLDMYLQDCNGMEIAQVLKQHPIWHSLPIIFMSAEDEADIIRRAESLSDSAFLTKPAKASQLTQEITRALNKSKS